MNCDCGLSPTVCLTILADPASQSVTLAVSLLFCREIGRYLARSICSTTRTVLRQWIIDDIESQCDKYDRVRGCSIRFVHRITHSLLCYFRLSDTVVKAEGFFTRAFLVR